MASASAKPRLVQWLLDTRHVWPNASQTKDLEHEAARALALLTEDERKGVLKYYQVRDAKMALGSHLLKHYVVAKYCGVPWRETAITRDSRGKPVYRDPGLGNWPVSFNVSHQAGIVALAAVHGYDGPVHVGTDVVCVDERRERDHKMIREEGWANFVDIHAEVFARSEANYLKYEILGAAQGLPAAASQPVITDFRLRCFYTLWCLREAYVKMSGEALVADWLKFLEFRKFQPPEPAESFDVSCGSTCDEYAVQRHDIYFRGEKVDDVNVSLRSLGPDYMTCTALRTASRKDDGLSIRIGPFQILSLDEVLAFAESVT